jgi:hypothetical protein
MMKAVLLLLLPAAALACDFHVAGSAATAAGTGAAGSFGSILEARAAVRSVLAVNRTLSGDLVVCLGAGIHGASAVSFSEEDSPAPGSPGRVVWRGTSSKADPTIISGGAQVTGWKATTIGGGPAFSAAVPTTAAKLPAIRQMWVGATRANRSTAVVDVNCTVSCTIPSASKGIQCAPGAAAPHSCPTSAPKCVGFENNVKWGQCEHCDCHSENALPILTPWVEGNNSHATVGYTTATPLPDSWTTGFKPNTIEFVWPIVIRNWIEPRCTIVSIQKIPNGNNLTLASPCGALLFARHGGAPPAPGRIEAVPPSTALAPGEFYHDVAAGMLYYQLAEGQTQADLEAKAWVAAEEILVAYTGTSGHSWEKVQFSYSTWMQANSADGYVDSQATGAFRSYSLHLKLKPHCVC